MAKIKKTSTITLKLSCAKFIDWFFNESGSNCERFAPGFNFGQFHDCVTISNITKPSSDAICDESVIGFYCYGVLRQQYELNAYWNITENKNCSKLKEDQYSCKYEMCVEYADGTKIEFVFKAASRYGEFKDYEQLEKNMMAEKIKHLNDRTVLCLEDKSILFSKACELIHDAIERGYYSGPDADIDLDELTNLDEIVTEWMEYKIPFSTEYILNQIQSPFGNLVGQATDEALNWFINGFKNGLLYRLY